MVWRFGSRIREKVIPDPGSRSAGQKRTGSGSRIRNSDCRCSVCPLISHLLQIGRTKTTFPEGFRISHGFNEDPDPLFFLIEDPDPGLFCEF
jgi:hypothetical protein